MASDLQVVLAGAMSHVVHELQRGDLALRAASLRSGTPESPLPYVLAARAMRAAFRAEVTVDDEDRILFIPLGHDVAKVADVRVDVDVQASLAGAEPAVATKFGYRPPISAEHDGRWLMLRLASGRTLRLAGDGDPAYAWGDVAGDSKAPVPTGLLADVVETAAGLGEPGRLGAPRELRLDRVHARMRGLLRTLVEGAGQVERSVADFDVEAAVRSFGLERRQLEGPWQILWGPYEFSAVRARLLLQLDREGRLRLDLDADEWQQVELQLERRASGDAFDLWVRFPDVIADGPFHGAFLDALRGEGKANGGNPRELLEHLPDGPSLAAFERELARPDLDATFARLDGDDRDLVLLRGVLGGRSRETLWHIRFDEVEPFPNVSAHGISEVRLLAIDSVGKMIERSDRAAGLLRRFYDALRLWGAWSET